MYNFDLFPFAESTKCCYKGNHTNSKCVEIDIISVTLIRFYLILYLMPQHQMLCHKCHFSPILMIPIAKICISMFSFHMSLLISLAILLILPLSAFSPIRTALNNAMKTEDETSLEMSLRFVSLLKGKVASRRLGLFMVQKRC